MPRTANGSSDDTSSTAATTTTNEQPQQQRPKWASIADRLNPNRAAFDDEFQRRWKTLSKAERKQLLAADQVKIQALKARGHQDLPFEALDEDHCETSPVAYTHVVPFLNLIAQRLRYEDPSQLRIYDPYYCAGGTVSHLQALGFPNVHNVAEDFYQVMAEQRIPEYDVLISNPPYSGNHFDRLLDFLQKHPIPFLLLLPSHFTKRTAYQKATTLTKHLVFLTPPERYHYWTPEGRRDDSKKKKRKHRNLHLGFRNSPFGSYWFISLQPLLSKKKVWKRHHKGLLELVPGCTLHETKVVMEGAAQVFRNSSHENDQGERKKKKKRRRTQAKQNDATNEGAGIGG